MQCFVRDVMDEKFADDQFANGCEQRDAKLADHAKFQRGPRRSIGLKVQTTRIPFVHAFR